MKSWYLTTQSPNITSGYEDDIISDYAQQNFDDITLTSFSDSVILYNYDMSGHTEIKCIIQGNTAGTRLKSMERQILCPVGTLTAGMYVLYKGNYWLVTGMPDDNKSYEKSTLDICQCKLRWQNSNGDIVERWCNATSSSKYGNGESGNDTIITTDDSLTLLLPNDDESLLLGDRDESNQRRVFIDKQEIPKKVYKITREDDVLYDYGKSGGILSFIAKKTELNKETDNQELRICDYITPTTSTEPTTPENPNQSPILWTMKMSMSGTPIIRIGGSKKTITAQLVDEDGNNVTDCTYIWTIATDFPDYIKYSQINNVLKIWATDELEENATVTVTVSSVTTGQETTETYSVELGV